MQAGRVEISIFAEDKASPKLKRVSQAAEEVVKKVAPVGDSFKKVGEASRGLGAGVDGLGSSLFGLGSAAGLAKGALAGVGIAAGIQAVKGLTEAGLAAERLQRTLRFATGGLQAGRDAFAFAADEANRLGVDLDASVTSFGKLAAAARGTALEGDGARKIFAGISAASATLGLSAEETGGALNAIQQMISKGTVSAEELRGQLGERLPGAFQIAARSMGVTTAQLGKMLEQGEVFADEFLPKFARALQEDFAKPAEEASNSASASLTRFSNASKRAMALAGEVTVGVLAPMADAFLGVAKAIDGAAASQVDFYAQQRTSLSPSLVKEQADAVERQRMMNAALKEAAKLKAEEEQKTRGPTSAQQAVIDKMKEEDAKKLKADAKAAADEAKRSADLQIEIENRVLESKRMARQKLKEMSKAATSPEARQGIADDEARTARAYARLEGDAARAARDLKIGAMKEGNAKELELINAREQDEVNAFRLSSAAKYMAAEEREASLTAIAQRYSNERKAISAAENQAIASASIGLAANVGQALQAMAGKNRAMAKAGMRLTQASAIASTAAGVAKAFEQGGVLGFITGAGIAAAGAAQVATIEQQINRFADGGIVPGTSTSGDRVPAMVNSKEMILTQQHQAGLWNFINGKGGAGAGNGGVSIGDIVINLPAGASEEDGRRAGMAASDTILSRLRGHVRDGRQAEYLGVQA